VLLTRALALPVAAAAVAALAPPGPARAWAALWLLGAFLLQSFDAPVVAATRYGLAMAADVAGALATAALVLDRGRDLGPAALGLAWAAGARVRAAVLAAAFAPRLLRPTGARPDPSYPRRALPFALVGLAGMAASRADLWLVTALLPAAALATYQVLQNLLLALQATGAWLLQPSVRALYRAGDATVRRVERGLLGLGAVVVAAGVPAAHLAVVTVYGLPLPWWLLPLEALVVLPVFAYSPWVYRLYRDGREKRVATVGAVAAALNLALTAALVGPCGLAGALVGAAGAQWVVLALLAPRRQRERAGGSGTSAQGPGPSRHAPNP